METRGGVAGGRRGRVCPASHNFNSLALGEAVCQIPYLQGTVKVRGGERCEPCFLSTVSSLLHCLRASALACSCAPVEPSGHFSDASPLLVPAPSDNHELTALTEYLRKLIKYCFHYRCFQLPYRQRCRRRRFLQRVDVD